jgi:hypothetical protein
MKKYDSNDFAGTGKTIEDTIELMEQRKKEVIRAVLAYNQVASLFAEKITAIEFSLGLYSPGYRFLLTRFDDLYPPVDNHSEGDVKEIVESAIETLQLAREGAKIG